MNLEKNKVSMPQGYIFFQGIADHGEAKQAKRSYLSTSIF